MRTTWLRRVVLPALIVLAAPLLAAERTGTRRVADPSGASSLELPADWQAWADGARLIALSPDGKVSARVEAAPRTARDLTHFTTLMSARWRRALPGWATKGKALLAVSGHEGLLIRAAARPRGREVAAVHLLVVTDRRQLSLTLACGAADVAALLPTFQAIMDSWRLTPPEAPPRPAALKTSDDPAGVYRIGLPDGWALQRRAGRLIANAPGGKASVSVLVGPRGARPLDRFAAGAVRAAKMGDPTWHQTSQRRVRLAGRDALRIGVSSARDGLARVDRFTCLFTERHEIVLATSCPEAERARWEPVFKGIGESFTLRAAAKPPASPGLRPGPKELPRPAPTATQVVRDPKGLFAFAVPRGWRVRHHGPKSSAVEPEQRFRAACAAAPKRAHSLEEFAQQLIRDWQRDVPAWRLLDQRAVRLAGRPATRIRASGKPGGVAMLADYHLVLTLTHQLVLSLERTEANSATWQALIPRIVASWQLAEPGKPLPRLPHMKELRDARGAWSMSVPFTWTAQRRLFECQAAEPTGKAMLILLAEPRRARDAREHERLAVAKLKAQFRAWRQTGVERVAFAGVEATRIRATCHFRGQPMVAEHYLAVTARHQVLLTLCHREHDPAPWPLVFEHMASSFQIR